MYLSSISSTSSIFGSLYDTPAERLLRLLCPVIRVKPIFIILGTWISYLLLNFFCSAWNIKLSAYTWINNGTSWLHVYNKYPTKY